MMSHLAPFSCLATGFGQPEAPKQCAASKDVQVSFLTTIVDWYFSRVFGHHEGGSVLPFYCDPKVLGHAAVPPAELAKGTDEALFRLLLVLAMYQARRDQLIQAQQRSWCQDQAATFLSLTSHRQAAKSTPCVHLATHEGLAKFCSIAKSNTGYNCELSQDRCPVILSAQIWGRMANLGKLPVSACQVLWQGNGLATTLEEAQRLPDQVERIEFVIGKISKIQGLGRKLATLYVAALSTPGLASNLTPWWPVLDGNLAVVIDTHAKRAIQFLSAGAAGSNYQSQVIWLREAAACIDLQAWRPDLPSHSPRLVQQALYSYCSRSNREARGLGCTSHCVPGLCPFHRADRDGSRSANGAPSEHDLLTSGKGSVT